MKRLLVIAVSAAFVLVGCSQQKKALAYDENAPCVITDSSIASTNLRKVQDWYTQKMEDGNTVIIWKDEKSGEFKACIKK
ncbi:MAG: hypothetical protein J5516_07165 [Bacteroidales bacterium]|nr:hypothetical protein [Bacteroidales bacterium]